MNAESNSNRAQEIKAALEPAYKNASKLKISKAEIKKLTKPFRDEEIEVRESDGAIFVPHIFISQRLNEVFSPGGWSLICREHYHDEDSSEIQAEYILIVRGCFIGEEVGEQPYSPLKGDKYSDALAFIAAKALRRICGLKFSCGSQLWQPTFCKKWLKKNAETFKGEHDETLWRKKGATGSMDKSETPLPKKQKVKADDNLRHVMLQLLELQGKENVLKFAVAEGILKEGQVLEDWPLALVAVGERETRDLQMRIQNFFNPPKVKSTKWEDFEIPFAGYEGRRLGSLKLSALRSYWEDLSSPMLIAKYPEFRKALDEAGRAHNFKKK